MGKERDPGGHTFSLTAKRTYTDIQNIRSSKLCIPKWHDKCFLNATFEIVKFKNIGVKIQLHQLLAHRSWVKVIVNPSSLLAGEYCPTRLFRDVKKIPEIRKKLQEILDECGIAVKLKVFKLNRVDLTRNGYFDSGDEMDARLDIFKKSYPIPRYKAVSFGSFSMMMVHTRMQISTRGQLLARIRREK